MHWTTIRIPKGQLDAVRAAMNAVVADAVGTPVAAVKQAGGPITAYYIDLPVHSQYMDQIAQGVGQYHASYWVRRNPRTDAQAQPADPTATSMLDAMSKHGEVPRQESV